MHWLNAILALAAYWGLATFEPTMSSSEGEWAFLPSDTSPALVLGLTAWLVFRRRERLAELPSAPGPVWLWGGLLAAALAVYVWATLVSAPDLLAPSLSLGLLGYACLFRGARAVRVMSLPAFFVLFAVPVPAPLLNEIVFRLQIWTAEYAGWILFLLGVPSLVEGELVAQADQAFKVIETCSGFRSVVTLLMLSVVLCDLFRRPPRHTLAMLSVAPLVAFALNGFRVVGLILNPHSAIAEVHNLQGVAILLAGLGVLYGLDGVLARLLGSDRDPERLDLSSGPHSGVPLAVRVAPSLLLSFALAGSLWLAPLEPWRSPLRVALLEPFDEEIAGWIPSRREIDQVFLGSTGFSPYSNRRFERDGESVDLFVAVGGHRERRERSLFSPKTGLPGGGWTLQEVSTISLAGQRLAVRRRVVRSGKHLRLVYHWYGGTPGRAGELLRTLFALDNGPFPRASLPFAVRLSTPMTGAGDEARLEAEDRLEDFYRALNPRLDRLAAALALNQPT